jgi:hypothetical protein
MVGRRQWTRSKLMLRVLFAFLKDTRAHSQVMNVADRCLIVNAFEPSSGFEATSWMHKQMTIESCQWEFLIFVCVIEDKIRMKSKAPQLKRNCPQRKTIFRAGMHGLLN